MTLRKGNLNKRGITCFCITSSNINITSSHPGLIPSIQDDKSAPSSQLQHGLMGMISEAIIGVIYIAFLSHKIKKSGYLKKAVLISAT
jgi:hypothetical protein